MGEVEMGGNGWIDGEMDDGKLGVSHGWLGEGLICEGD